MRAKNRASGFFVSRFSGGQAGKNAKKKNKLKPARQCTILAFLGAPTLLGGGFAAQI